MDGASRARGSLIGLATGDAVGTTLEFTHDPEPIDDMVGGGPFRLAPGQWTDDTSMALCLAVSLIERGGFDARDQMDRYLRWYREGYLSSTGRCFDIGNTTRAALDHFARTGNPLAGSTDARAAGNGSLMRLCPIPIRYHHDPEVAVALAGESSRTTHAALEAIDACRFYAALIVGALAGVPREALLAPGWSPVPGLWERAPLAPEIARVAAGSYRGKPRAQIRSGGYVVESLEAALWAFSQAEDFRHGCLLVVNLGHDADTTGAIYGQLAGAHFGEGGIPAAWRAKLTMGDRIAALADELFGGSAADLESRANRSTTRDTSAT
ncbi:MAG: ADP-ribosylglycohydrolase family protein [Deltaproteobacteria bacterium]|nr:ADP-ribosylglycohydrolase family protein [Deltaproteobacteria bacterium]